MAWVLLACSQTLISEDFIPCIDLWVKNMTAMIEKLVKEAAMELTQHRFKLVTAESCTGGGLAYWLTSLPDSSAWFERGFVTYSNEAKIEQIGVNPLTLDSCGAVSEATAREMAEGALEKSNANLSIAITGIAGPGGGTKAKPVGLVWIAISQQDFGTEISENLFAGTRTEIRNQSIQKALETLLDVLKMKAEKIPTI